MLVNLSVDEEVLANLVQDDVFLETLFNKMMVIEFGLLQVMLSPILTGIVIRMSKNRMPMKSQCY